VRAYDKAGNVRAYSTTFVVKSSQAFSSSYAALAWYILLSLIILGVLIYIFRWQYKIKKELGALKAQMRRDLRVLEGELKSGERGSLERDIKHIEGDMEEKIKKIDDTF
jgi:Flp pilus assembly protein TadB